MHWSWCMSCKFSANYLLCQTSVTKVKKGRRKDCWHLDQVLAKFVAPATAITLENKIKQTLRHLKQYSHLLPNQGRTEKEQRMLPSKLNSKQCKSNLGNQINCIILGRKGRTKHIDDVQEFRNVYTLAQHVLTLYYCCNWRKLCQKKSSKTLSWKTACHNHNDISFCCDWQELYVNMYKRQWPAN